MNTFDVPILLIMFNRPNLAKQVILKLREVKPTKVYIAIDGPRIDRVHEDMVNIEQCKYLIHHIDWDCQILTLFRDKNLGCKLGVSQAIDWFFDNEEHGIILEDDCLPSDSFFYFCHEVLNRYIDDTRIMHISGVNFFNDSNYDDSTYFFTKVSHIWGWATWKRAWKKYDLEMRELPIFLKQNKLNDISNNNKVRKFWEKAFLDVYNKSIDTWDYQWTYSIWKNNGLCIQPNFNLVSNIGFGADATHTHDKGSKFSNLSTKELETIIHPVFIIENTEATKRSMDSFFKLNTWFDNKLERIKLRIKLKKLHLK